MTRPKYPLTLRLPHPYLTTYQVQHTDGKDASEHTRWLQLHHAPRAAQKSGASSHHAEKAPPEQLDSDVRFSEPVQTQTLEELPPDANNLYWAQVRRSPKSDWAWHSSSAPTVAQAWLIIYALFTLRPELEHFRLSLSGSGSAQLANDLKLVTLAIPHPAGEKNSISHPDELVILRSTFWQGAGSPFGSRPVWAPETHHLSVGSKELSEYPAAPLEYMIDTQFPESRIHSFHPRRPPKPKPGAVIYSRYIPHLDEHFSMVALDYENDEHLQLFHAWQNDPRVSAGWNETGTLKQHKEYLRRLHEDAHVLTVLAKFDDVCFAYFEIYWAKEDHFGAYIDAGDFDRGRHSLVGNIQYRGAHRVSAWWSSLLHYMFLDEPRTLAAVGEPKATNTTVLSYDLMCGFGVQKFVDLPHKRSAFMKCSRERFFQLCPLGWIGERNVGGTGIKLFAKL